MKEEKERERRLFMRRFNFIFFIIFILFVSLVLRLAYVQLVEGEKYTRAASQLSVKSLYTKATRGWIYDRNGEVLANNKPVYTLTFLNENRNKEQIEEIATKLEELLYPIDQRYTRVYILEKMDSGWVYTHSDAYKEAQAKLQEEAEKQLTNKQAADEQEQESDEINQLEEIPKIEPSWVFNPDDWKLVSYSDIKIPLYQPRTIMTNVPKEVMFYVEEHRTELPGVSVEVDSIRIYKKGDIAPHIIGYTKPIPANRLDEYLSRGYNPSDIVGVSGVEQYYEEQLRGTEGRKEVHVNNLLKTMQTEEIQPQQPGNNLVLTIDINFQAKVEKILEDGVNELRNDPKKPNPNVNYAIAVVMDPHTGEIYAMANYPDYDLNIYNSPDFGQRYQTEVAGREQNLALDGYYAPGSTVKMLSVLIGLEEGLVGQYDRLPSTGSVLVGDRPLRDWKASGHGPTDARKAIKESVNSYMYQLALRLANYPASKTLYKEKFDTIHYYQEQFGLGVKTGIDLPNEKVILSGGARELGRLAHAMIGQYDSYTPIQLAQYVATIANGGYRMRPYVVKEIREPVANLAGPGRLVTVNEPEVLNQVNIKPENLKVVQEGMLQVTQPGGTAYWPFVGLPFQVAAKTGTAQSTGADNNGLIVGYAPYDDPQMVFVVVVPKAGGSEFLGGMTRAIVDAYFGLDQAPEEQTSEQTSAEPTP